MTGNGIEFRDGQGVLRNPELTRLTYDKLVSTWTNEYGAKNPDHHAKILEAGSDYMRVMLYEGRPLVLLRMAPTPGKAETDIPHNYETATEPWRTGIRYENPGLAFVDLTELDGTEDIKLGAPPSKIAIDSIREEFGPFEVAYTMSPDSPRDIIQKMHRRFGAEETKIHIPNFRPGFRHPKWPDFDASGVRPTKYILGNEDY